MWQASVILILSALCAIMMILERRGLQTTLTLSFKADIKRETRFLAQYGQMICTALTAILILQLDNDHGGRKCVALSTTVAGVATFAMILKRIIGRARPRSPHAGQFLGPSIQHANFRESFPSSHSASAFAFSGILAHAYPHAAGTFWTLALVCACLRYVMDAHWPSDVLGGIALGYLASVLGWLLFFP